MGNKRDSLGDRMKRYEYASRDYLTRRIPAIIRVDGKAFHTFTRGMKKPFDEVLATTMHETMRYLCKNIQGCVFGYTQSDEITLVLTDYATISTDAWFGYNVQKMCSIAASMAALAFNTAFSDIGSLAIQYYDTIASPESVVKENYMEYADKFNQAMFDARAFSLPIDEVCNCLIWRQQDATRNSIEAVGQANFSHRELHGKSCNEIQEMLWSQRGINWNNYPIYLKRGACCYRKNVEKDIPDPKDADSILHVVRREWAVDLEPPIFTQDRTYVERWL